MIGSRTLGIKTPLQLTVNVMGASCDLFTYTWIFNMGNLPREMLVTLLNTVSRGRTAISHGKSAACSRTYYISHFKRSVALS